MRFSKVALMAFVFLGVTLLKSEDTFAARSKYRQRTQSNQSRYRSSTLSKEGIRMRKVRRMAVGAVGGGAAGVAGVNMELNVTPDYGFLVGYGGGQGYQSVNVQVKHYIGGESFMPYMAGGYARWFSDEGGSELSTSNPRVLSEKFLNAEEVSSTEFAVNMIYPSVGIQYVQLDGSMAGVSFFAEVSMLIEMRNFQAAPTGAFGLMYYF